MRLSRYIQIDKRLGKRAGNNYWPKQPTKRGGKRTTRSRHRRSQKGNRKGPEELLTSDICARQNILSQHFVLQGDTAFRRLINESEKRNPASERNEKTNQIPQWVLCFDEEARGPVVSTLESVGLESVLFLALAFILEGEGGGGLDNRHPCVPNASA